MSKTCRTCISFSPYQHEPNLGECRANPPVLQWIVLPQETLKGRELVPTPACGFPQVTFSTWCTKHTFSPAILS
jgi:hypothetical protein